MTTARRTEPRARPARSPRIFRRAVALSALLLFAAGAASGEPRTIVLFDGKSLDGWKPTDFFKPGEVKVEGGAIVMATGRPMTGVTSTRRDLPTTDYELTYEARRVAGDDFFAAATFPVDKSHVTFVNGGWGGNVTGLSSLNGSDASENETNTFIKYENGKWYRFRVRVTKSVLRGWVDDKEVFAVDHANVEVGTRIETRASRPLGFATWETTGAVRKVEVRLLTPAEVAATKPVD